MSTKGVTGLAILCLGSLSACRNDQVSVSCDGRVDAPPCASADGPTTAVTESEPNDAMEEATVAPLSLGSTVRISGTLPSIQTRVDVDVYDLGPLPVGTRVCVQVETPGAALHVSAALVEAFPGFPLLAEIDTRPFTSDDPFVLAVADSASTRASSISMVIRPGASNEQRGLTHLLVVARSPISLLLQETEYALSVSAERGNRGADPYEQAVFLNFAGGRVAIDGAVQTLPEFDAASIDEQYSGETERLADSVVENVNRRFAGYRVRILDSRSEEPPPDQPFSTIHFGGTTSAAFGFAMCGVDPGNSDPSDEAIVFTDSMDPSQFSLIPDVEQLANAIGNVAAHEIGHMLGMYHVQDQADIMNTYDNRDTVLFEQRFRESLINNSVFQAMATLRLRQSGAAVLQRVVGFAREPDTNVALPSILPETIANGGVGDDPPKVFVATAQEVVVFDTESASSGLIETRRMPAGLEIGHMITGDFNADGSVDVVAVGTASELNADDLVVLLSKPAGGIPSPAAIQSVDSPEYVATGDFDGDGDSDLVVGSSVSNAIGLLLNEGDGRFTAGPTADLDLVLGVAGGDLDGDGRDEILTAGLALEVLRLDSELALSNVQSVPTENMLTAPVVVDLNADGAPDVVAVNYYSVAMSIAFNDGDGTLGTLSVVDVDEVIWYPTAVLAVQTGDFDGDGLVDLAVSKDQDESIAILRGDGNGEFTLFASLYLPTIIPGRFVAADVNRDGLDDLIVPVGAQGVSVFLHHGDGEFGRLR